MSTTVKGVRSRVTGLLAVVDRASNVILVACALTVTAMLLKQQVRPGQSQGADPTVPIAGRHVMASEPLGTGLLLGDTTARTRLVEFADFQCPFCARAATELHDLEKLGASSFAVEFHHSPIPSHPFAMDAAKAAECAAHQGRFKEFYFLAYDHQADIGHWPWDRFAEKAGVPRVPEFVACMRADETTKRVVADAAVATELGVRGTPTWLVRDSLYGGLPPVAQLQQWTAGVNTISRAQKPQIAQGRR